MASLLAAAGMSWAGAGAGDPRLAVLPPLMAILASGYALRERRIRPHELGRMPVGSAELRLARIAAWVFEPAGAPDIAVRIEDASFGSAAAYVGLPRPVLVLSERLVSRFRRGDLDEEAVLGVLLHERAHREGHDVLHRTLARVAVRLAVATPLCATVLLPWSPGGDPVRAAALWLPAIVVHWGATRMARLLEWRADDRAVRDGGGPGLLTFFERSAVEDRLGALARPCDAATGPVHEAELAALRTAAARTGDADVEVAAGRLLELHRRWTEDGPRWRRLASIAWGLDHSPYWIRRHPSVEARVRRLRAACAVGGPPVPGGS